MTVHHYKHHLPVTTYNIHAMKCRRLHFNQAIVHCSIAVMKSYILSHLVICLQFYYHSLY